MLQIGTIELKRTLDEGQFQCPICESLEVYRIRSSRPFLTIYFIPVVPVGKCIQFVECLQCKQTFQPTILNRASKQEQPQDRWTHWQSQLLHSLATLMNDDGHITETEISAAQLFFEKVTNEPLDRETLGICCSEVQLMNQRSLAYFRQVSGNLTLDQKRELVQAAFIIATCESDISANRNATLIECRNLFNLSEREYRAAIEQAIQYEI